MKKIALMIVGLLLVAAAPSHSEVYLDGFLQGLFGGRLDKDNPTSTEQTASETRLQLRAEHFGDKGEFFSRGLQSPLSGTTDWSTGETPFFLKKGENPDNVKLNLVIDGKGTVWIDDIHLFKGPLK